MPISPIGSAGAAASFSIPPVRATQATEETKSFGDVVGGMLEGLQSTQAKADNLAVEAATGDLTDVHDFMIASTEANIATELTAAVRNKAVEAFNEIMRMPV